MIKKLVEEVNELKLSVRTLQVARYPTSSTRLEGVPSLSASRRRGSPHVNFQDTFTYADFDSSSPNAQPSMDARRESNRVFPQRQARNGVTQDQSTRQTDVPQQTNRDVGQVVCKWHIKFSGSAKEPSVELFLTRLEECRALANLTHDELLSSLSEILTGVAATWYRNNRHTCMAGTEDTSSAF